MTNIIAPTILSPRHLLVLWSLSPNTAFVPNFHEDCHYHSKSPTGKMLPLGIHTAFYCPFLWGKVGTPSVY